MAGYQCPLCGRQLERELLLFLDHTNQHIIDRIKESHPEWIAENGVCPPCLDYYQSEISGKGFNIGPTERRKRVFLGITSLVLGFSAGFYLSASALPRILRLGLFVPLFGGIFCLIQAREKTCSVMAEMGVRNLDLGEEKIQDLLIVENLKKKGRLIVLKSALAAALITIAFLLIPSRS